MTRVSRPAAFNAAARKAARRLDRVEEALARREARAGFPDEPDLRRFIEGLKIVNKRGEWVPLIVNPSQEKILDLLLQQRALRKPGRFICLKARQMGVSTLIEAFIFALVFFRANRRALVAAHSLESARTIFSIARRFLAHLPDDRFRKGIKANEGLIRFPSPHNSLMRAGTANDRTLGRGGVIHYVHASEAAFWRRPEAPVAAIAQCVPLEWDTLVFWESTANGMNNFFHRTWIEAEAGESDMTPIFLPWTQFPEYSTPPGPARERITAEEVEYARREGLTPEQAAWARYVRVNQCHGSWNKFHQEYPARPELAFMFTGMPWFDPEAVSAMLEAASRVSRATGFLRRSTDERTDAITFHEDPAGPLTVWKAPESGRSYSLGMDVGEGVGGDYTVIQVVCDDTGEVVARYRSNRVRPENAAVDARLLGEWYHWGLLGVERNGPGLAVLGVCERGDPHDPGSPPYPNLYYHIVTDRRLLQETTRLGWLTTRASKEAMLGRLARAIEEGELTVFSKTTLMEMRGFVWDAQAGSFVQQWVSPDSRLAHDDEIMALAVANEMRILRPGPRLMHIRPSQEGTF
jgi:hypothetical protein